MSGRNFLTIRPLDADEEKPAVVALNTRLLFVVELRIIRVILGVVRAQPLHVEAMPFVEFECKC